MTISPGVLSMDAASMDDGSSQFISTRYLESQNASNLVPEAIESSSFATHTDIYNESRLPDASLVGNGFGNYPRLTFTPHQPTTDTARMDGYEELISPEASRLLDESFSAPRPLSMSPWSPMNEDRSKLDPPSRIHKHGNGSYKTPQIPGCSTLDFAHDSGQKRKRSRFDENTRAKVKAVRKKGACFRCRVTKTPVGKLFDCEKCSDRTNIVFWWLALRILSPKSIILP